MEGFTEEGKAVGVLLDISLRHESTGARVLDLVKEQLVEVVKNHFDDGLDVLYLYHPDLVDPVNRHGEQTHHISNYDTDGWLFNMNFALKQTLYALGMQECDLRRYLVLITDRMFDIRPLELVIQLNDKDMLDAQLILVGIGDHYDQPAFAALAKEGKAIHIHLNSASELIQQLCKEHYGPENICCPTNERCQ
jgi:hypothetical protein